MTRCTHTLTHTHTHAHTHAHARTHTHAHIYKHILGTPAHIHGSTTRLTGRDPTLQQDLLRVAGISLVPVVLVAVRAGDDHCKGCIRGRDGDHNQSGEAHQQGNGTVHRQSWSWSHLICDHEIDQEPISLFVLHYPLQIASVRLRATFAVLSLLLTLPA